jgi:hypothetical protein
MAIQLQAARQVVAGLDTKSAAFVIAAGDFQTLVNATGRGLTGNTQVNLTVNRDLSRSCTESGQSGQSNECLFHVNLKKLVQSDCIAWESS